MYFHGFRNEMKQNSAYLKNGIKHKLKTNSDYTALGWPQAHSIWGGHFFFHELSEQLGGNFHNF